MKKTTSKMVESNQTEFPEFLQDIPATQQAQQEAEQAKQETQLAQAEVLDMEKLSSQLHKATEYINKEVGGMAKSFCRIGFKLWEVRENKMYLGEGFKNVYEYGERTLGFKKASTAKYISVCERFSVRKNDKPTAQLVSNFASFSYTQLSEMLALPEAKIEEVTPDTKCADIRAMAKAAKKGSDNGDSAEPDGESNGLYAPGVRVAPPISIFERVLTKENMPLVLKLLHENIGREVQILVEDNGIINAE